jgi:hypothetical protein
MTFHGVRNLPIVTNVKAIETIKAINSRLPYLFEEVGVEEYNGLDVLSEMKQFAWHVSWWNRFQEAFSKKEYPHTVLSAGIGGA